MTVAAPWHCWRRKLTDLRLVTDSAAVGWAAAEPADAAREVVAVAATAMATVGGQVVVGLEAVVMEAAGLAVAVVVEVAVAAAAMAVVAVAATVMATGGGREEVC